MDANKASNILKAHFEKQGLVSKSTEHAQGLFCLDGKEVDLDNVGGGIIYEDREWRDNCSKLVGFVSGEKTKRVVIFKDIREAVNF